MFDVTVAYRVHYAYVSSIPGVPDEKHAADKLETLKKAQRYADTYITTQPNEFKLLRITKVTTYSCEVEEEIV